MSSLAATQADGYYRPSDWDGKASLNKITGSKGHNQWLKDGVIRFELPYTSVCTKCESYMGKGVRFNAKKVDAGKYFTTKIYEFQMKCPTCKNRLVIRTDPKNADYEYVEGIRRREQEYDPEEIGLPVLSVEPSSSANAPTVSAMNAVAVDPLMALEKSKDDKRKINAAAARLEELMGASQRLEADNYGVNALLRNKFRGEKKATQALEAEGLDKGLRFALLPPSEEDARAAPLAMAEASGGGMTRARREGFKQDAKSKFARIMGAGIFDCTGSSGGGGGGGKAAASTTSTSTALVKRSRSGVAAALQSKAKADAALKQGLAVKRAKLSIDPRAFSIGAKGQPPSSSSLSSMPSTVVVKKKKGKS